VVSLTITHFALYVVSGTYDELEVCVLWKYILSFELLSTKMCYLLKKKAYIEQRKPAFSKKLFWLFYRREKLK